MNWCGVNDESEMTDFDRQVHAAYLEAEEGRKRAKVIAREQIARERGINAVEFGRPGIHKHPATPKPTLGAAILRLLGH